MRIENRTHWRTDHLRAFLYRVGKEELEASTRKALRVTVSYNRQRDRGSCSGWAVLGALRIKILVPSLRVDKVDLAHTIAHEMAHARGVGHRGMTGAKRYQRVDGHRDFYSWAESFPLEKKQDPPRLSAQARAEKRREHLRRLIARWERREKLAKTMLRKWRRRLKDFDRRLVVRASQTAGAKPEATLQPGLERVGNVEMGAALDA